MYFCPPMHVHCDKAAWVHIQAIGQQEGNEILYGR